MANLLTWSSYEMKGTKESFANWISCLSPTDTPFGSMVKKVNVGNTNYQWQTDRLKPAALNHQVEGSDAAPYTKRSPTTKHTGYTQIFRKTGAISDTVESQDYWGRVKETKYQLSKLAAEIKRDLEYTFLSFQAPDAGSFDDIANDSTERKTGGFLAQLGPLSDYDPNNTEQNFFAVNNVTVDLIKDMVGNLFTLGSNANVIMYHPSLSGFFSSWMEVAPLGGVRQRMFNNLDSRINTWVKKYRDAFGKEYTLIPNRFCQKNVIYFFNPINFRQMVLREPKHWELDRTGSAQKHMIEMEVGLRHANPQISGAIVIKDKAATPVFDKGYIVNLPIGGALTITEINGVIAQWSANSANISFGQATPTDANVIQIESGATVGDSYTIFFNPTTPIQQGRYWGQATITVNVVAANSPNITTRMAKLSTTPVDDSPYDAPGASLSDVKAEVVPTPKKARKTRQKASKEV